jgi:hypothetical protein
MNICKNYQILIEAFTHVSFENLHSLNISNNNLNSNIILNLVRNLPE